MNVVVTFFTLLLLSGGLRSAQAQVGKPSTTSGLTVKPSITQTDMTLLVNAGSLGSQPTTVLTGEQYSGTGKFSPNGSFTPGPINGALSGLGGGTKLPSKKGTYGLSFNAVEVLEMYNANVLKHLDDLIEAGNLYLNPSSSAITEYIIDLSLQQIAQKEAQANINEAKGNYRYYYARFVQSLRDQLAGVNYIDVMASDPVGFFTPIIKQAGTDQCVSYCQSPMLEWTVSGSKQAAGYIAMNVATILGYQNVAKQDNPIFKMLYDAYAARQKGAQYGAYQPLVQRHATKVPFTLYGLQFGTLASLINMSKKVQASSGLWDSQCNCPDNALFDFTSFKTQSAFVVP